MGASCMPYELALWSSLVYWCTVWICGKYARTDICSPLQELLNAAAWATFLCLSGVVICSFCRARLSRLLKTMQCVVLERYVDGVFCCLPWENVPASFSVLARRRDIEVDKESNCAFSCHAKWDCVLIVTLQWNISPYSDITHCSSTCGTWTAAG
jgi:hypothetical protein